MKKKTFDPIVKRDAQGNDLFVSKYFYCPLDVQVDGATYLLWEHEGTGMLTADPEKFEKFLSQKDA